MRTLRLSLGIGAALVLTLPSALPGTEADPVEMPNVGVVVRNFSAAPLDLVQKAEANCEQIYRAAGIRLTGSTAWKTLHGKVQTSCFEP